MTLKLFFVENTKNFCTYEHKSKLFGLLAGNNVVISVSVLPETTMSFVARMPNNLPYYSKSLGDMAYFF